jgi:hypothetical protein
MGRAKRNPSFCVSRYSGADGKGPEPRFHAGAPSTEMESLPFSPKELHSRRRPGSTHQVSPGQPGESRLSPGMGCFGWGIEHPPRIERITLLKGNANGKRLFHLCLDHARPVRGHCWPRRLYLRQINRITGPIYARMPGRPDDGFRCRSTHPTLLTHYEAWRGRLTQDGIENSVTLFSTGSV